MHIYNDPVLDDTIYHQRNDQFTKGPNDLIVSVIHVSKNARLLFGFFTTGRNYDDMKRWLCFRRLKRLSRGCATVKKRETKLMDICGGYFRGT